MADGYFNTVELNDGNVFTPFDLECGRLENGILTTAATSGSAGAISPGCEAQFKLGIYRINKRIRERRYPLIDVERGVVVSTGFFDHANEFDRYKLTDGREMKTALKWPNSISLIEAFKVRDSKIYRIEAVFSYVPHRMHNPFYVYPPAPAAQPEDAATLKERCDKACLLALGDKLHDGVRQPEARRRALGAQCAFHRERRGHPGGRGHLGLDPQQVRRGAARGRRRWPAPIPGTA